MTIILCGGVFVFVLACNCFILQNALFLEKLEKMGLCDTDIFQIEQRMLQHQY
jgi:hypothetical protein